MDDYQHHLQHWRWQVPDFFNVGTACLRAADSPSSAARTAILWEDESGARAAITYGELRASANRFANALRALGVNRGDRVAICLPQRIETAVAHLAIYRLGAVAVPLTVLFGADAVEYRLSNADCKIAVCDDASLANVLSVRSKLPKLAQVIACAGASDTSALDWSALVAGASEQFEPIQTHSNDPALIIYTSGTTGPPKGALLPHRAMLGNWSGFLYSHNLLPETLPKSGAPFVFWSPADWAWTGGLWDALLPTLFGGGTIVGYRGRFDPHRAFALMEKYQVVSTFLFPTALKMMMKAIPAPREQFKLTLQSIMSAGESVGQTVFDWTEQALGVKLNEMFGQTELNYVVGNCSGLWPAKPGSMGRGYPGHQVTIIDDEGNPLAAGQTGDVAVNRYDVHGELDPVFFLGYLNNEAGTQAKYSGDWCRTGDMARLDAEGYLWYEGRSDDVIKSAGYRIGPAEVESCLIQHPAVAMAAVIGKPDSERGAIVKAFIVLAAGHVASDELRDALAQHVRGKLAPYEYPKEIEFVNDLPMTTTGKLQRKVLRERESAK
ncbi:MAG: AMP-binding protein [Betaproteobacteria bacterium]|nr:MAG: AMP-binding protein [Betaproteobacteria bacterium]